MFKLSKTFSAHKDSITECTLSSDSLYSISASVDNTIAIWNINSLEHVTSLRHPTSVSSVDLSKDDSKIVSSSSHFVHLFDVSSGKELNRYSSNLSRVVSTRFFHYNSLLVSANVSGEVFFWDVRKHRSKPVHSVSFPDSISSISCYQFGKPLVGVGFSDSFCRVIDFTTNQIYSDNIGQSSTGICLSPDGFYYVSLSSCSSFVYLIDVFDGSCLVKIKVADRDYKSPIRVSPFGDLIAFSDQIGDVTVFDPVNDNSQVLKCGEDVITALSFGNQRHVDSFEGLTLLVGDKKGRIHSFVY
ncbi:hypothetical protein RCL1_005404 [Eukaryota sp. TZLM3-RCL]